MLKHPAQSLPNAHPLTQKGCCVQHRRPPSLREHLKRRGIFLLPNLLTTASLFSGFFSVIQAMDGHFHIACVAILVAVIFDSLDGRVARFTRTQSTFGAEYDSLSDMLSFGVAPAILMYQWSLHYLGEIGWAASFLYCICTALRLARFNATLDVIDKRFFQGLPSPAAAALLASFVWMMSERLHHTSSPLTRGLSWLSWSMALFAGLTMVSNICYTSGKTVNMRKSVQFSTAVWAAIVLTGFSQIVRNLSETLFALCAFYAASGYFLYLKKHLVDRYRTKKTTTSF